MEDNKGVSREQFIIQDLQHQIGTQAAVISDLKFTCIALEEKIKELENKEGDKE